MTNKQKIKQEFVEETNMIVVKKAKNIVYPSDEILEIFEKKLNAYSEQMCNLQRELCAQQISKFKFASSSESANKVFGALHQTMIEACKNAPSPMTKEKDPSTKPVLSEAEILRVTKEKEKE